MPLTVGADVALRAVVHMRKVFVDPEVLPEPRFRDGLGIRYVRTAGTDDPVEVLRPLWDVGSMQNAIRQRVSRLSSFRQARFVPVRGAEVPRDDASTIEVVSDFVAGHRLSQYLEASQRGAVSIEASAAVYILRELLGALALLHESRGVTHGAIGPERLLITPKGRVVVADYVLGPAIERLEFTRPRLWREFRIPLPAGKGTAKLDGKADVVQVGVTALALLLGRPIELEEYPGALDDLLASLNHTQRTAARPSLPATLVGWVKRAVGKDSAGKFDNVSDARMSLEAVVSKQDAASGGTVALKALADVFGRYAAAQEASAAAVAADEARKTALAAQAAAMDAIRAAAADTDAAGPAAGSVPAFTLLSEAPAAPQEGTAQTASLADELVPAVESDPPVGWRVPEAPPVEETLPTSPLLRVDTPAVEPPAEEFAEEVLDLSGLAGSDDDGLVSADELAAARATAATVELAEGLEPIAATAEALVEIIVDLRELNAADFTAECAETMAASVDASQTALEAAEPEAVAVTADPDVVLPEQPIETVAAVDAALAALAAMAAQAPEAPAGALPEWRLLADPMGAVAPTIDVEEPTETLEELVAAFEAMKAVGEAPAAAADSHPVEVEPPIAMAEVPSPIIEPPVTMVETCVPLVDAPAEQREPIAVQMSEAAAPQDAIPSVLDEILGLQEAQAEAQTATEIRPEQSAVEPDVAAWSFVEELMHRDTPHAVRQASEYVPRQPVVEEAPPLSRVFEDDTEPVAVVDAPEEFPSVFAAAAATAEDPLLDALAHDADTEAAPVPEAIAPALEDAAPELPTDWLIEVGHRPAVQAPVLFSRTGPSEAPQAEVPAPALTVEPPPPAFTDASLDGEMGLPPVVEQHPVPPEPDEDLNAPIFPRIAPSVQRVRAEARRRRLARIGNGIGRGLHAVVSACAAGVGAVASGLTQVFTASGRGVVAAVRAVLAGFVFALASVWRGAGGLIRATATGMSAVLRSAAAAGRASARATGAILSAAVKGAGRGLHASAAALAASARMASKAAGTVLRAAGGAMSASARGLAAGVGALGRSGSVAALRSARWAAAASASLGRTAGRALAKSASAAGGLGHAAGRAASATAAAGGLARHGAAKAGRGVGRAAGRAASAAAGAGGLAARGGALAGKGFGRAVVTVPRKLYFVVSDLADHLPKPVFRPWYLAAALVVIVAVAGVPYAKAWWYTVKPAVGSIRVESGRPGAVVTIDGVSQGRAPLTASVPEGRHRVEITGAGRTETREVEVAAGRETLVQPAGADPTSTGSIRVTTEPAGVEVLVDGGLQGRSPLTIENLAVGAHTVLVHDESGLVRRTVRVRAGEAVEVTLQIRPGWLAVFAPVKLEILENGRPIGSTEGGRVLSSPGPHTIELVSQSMGFRETRQVDIKPGEVAAVTVQMPPATIEIVAPAEAEILVDGQPVGQAPLGSLKIAVGTREIMMRHPTLGERRQVVSVTYNGPARVVFE